MPNKTAVYCRVSSVGQNLQGQQEAIQRWLDGHRITDAVWFSDKTTGKKLDRPAFNKLQAGIFNGEIDTVVVWKLDRLSRSLRDGINTLGDWCKRGVRVVSVTQTLDFNGALGEMLAAIFFAVAQMETELREERQQEGIKVAKRNGVYKGRVRGTTKATPARAAALRAKGLTVEEVATSLGVSTRTTARYLSKQ